MAMETVITCVDCGKTFLISTEEKKWYEEKGFDLPKRCVECRKARRSARGKNRKQG